MHDRLSQLTFEQAARLLGRDGKWLLIRGGKLDFAAPEDIRIAAEEVTASLSNITVKLTLDPSAKDGLRIQCSRCKRPCVHSGALLSVLLESKTTPTVRATDEVAIAAEALAEREARAKKEKMEIESADEKTPWTDYVVTSELSGKSYRVALRGEARGISYCACPDFRVNTLGTCKHVMKVLAHATKTFSKSELAEPYKRKRVTIHLTYGDDPWFGVALPHEPSAELQALVPKELTVTVERLVRMLQDLEAGGHPFFVTPDAELLLERELTRARLHDLTAEIRKSPKKHPLLTTLLREPLLPYQLDGIAFAVGAGRAILADEMGLGKTIQGVGVAELLAREVGIKKVLVICPASLKAQWRSEIERFCERTVALSEGASDERASIYANDAFFTVCNYEQILKDIGNVEKTRWDLIILDEGQRIKNWEAKTSRVVKGLSSRFALVLSGTPLENRLDDLHSVVAFVDPHRLGPAFKFLPRHEKRDAEGKLVGFKNLDELRKRLIPVLLRRTRESVRLELPERSQEIVRIAPSTEQKDLHDQHMRTVAQLVSKPFLTEVDLLRLRAALLMCRMAADSTVLVDHQPPGHSTKLERLADIFDAVANEPDRKVVLFSEWTSMLDLIEPLLTERALGFVRLDGSVTQKKRALIVEDFQENANTRVFLTTNAGSTGLNLQAANTVINVDLPWNPAVLEQRIARAHRMGQTRAVTAIVLVTEQTIEENLLTTLATKRDLALAALDPESDVSSIDVKSQTEDIKRKLGLLIEQEAPAQPDKTQEARTNLLRAALDYVSAVAGEEVRAQLDVKIENGRLSFALPTNETLAKLLEGLVKQER